VWEETSKKWKKKKTRHTIVGGARLKGAVRGTWVEPWRCGASVHWGHERVEVKVEQTTEEEKIENTNILKKMKISTAMTRKSDGASGRQPP